MGTLHTPRALSLLTAWLRLLYTAIVLVGWLNLVTVYRFLTTPDYLTAFGSAPLHAQVKLLLNSFRYDWSISLVIFGIHLVLLGYLIYRSAYIPKIIGMLLVIERLGVGDRQLATLPLSERPSAVPVRHFFRRTDLHALALDQGLENPRARALLIQKLWEQSLRFPVSGLWAGCEPIKQNKG